MLNSDQPRSRAAGYGISQKPDSIAQEDSKIIKMRFDLPRMPPHQKDKQRRLRHQRYRQSGSDNNDRSFHQQQKAGAAANNSENPATLVTL